MSRPPGLRTCVVCGQKRHQQTMLRLVLDETGRVLIDIKREFGGRGAYVCKTCVDGLIKIKPPRWNRIFRRPVKGPVTGNMEPVFLGDKGGN